MDKIVPNDTYAKFSNEKRYARAIELLKLQVSASPKKLTQLDIHNLLAEGIPYASCFGVYERLHETDIKRKILKILGISLRKLKENFAIGKTLDVHKSNILWNFSASLSDAILLLGSEHAAERWHTHPAIGLNYKEPIDLLTTTEGTILLRDYIFQIYTGVYI